MKSHNSLTLALIFLLLFFVFLGQGYGERARRVDSFQEVCDFVRDRIFIASNDLKDWHHFCYLQAGEIGLFESHSGLVERLQSTLQQLRVSHLSFLTSEENRSVWTGQYRETGLRVQSISGHYMVTQVIMKSPAHSAGVRVGDEILLVNGSQLTHEHEARERSGVYVLYRFSEQGNLSVTLNTEVVQVDSSPELRVLKDTRWAYLKVSSFRIEYFDKKDWLSLVQELQKYNGVVLDLRDNTGGSFVSVIRVLSSLMCRVNDYGSLVRRSGSAQQVMEFQDENSNVEFINDNPNYTKIRLKRFTSYPCYEGDLAVLINAETASVSEILADNLSRRHRTILLGERTSGDVVLSAWYDRYFDSKMSHLSIPEALYVGEQGSLEGLGLLPDRFIYNSNIHYLRRGEDELIEEALQWFRSWNPKKSTP